MLVHLARFAQKFLKHKPQQTRDQAARRALCPQHAQAEANELRLPPELRRTPAGAVDAHEGAACWGRRQTSCADTARHACCGPLVVQTRYVSCTSFYFTSPYHISGKTKAFLSKRAYSTLRERQRAQEKALGEVVQAFCRARFAVTQVQVMRGDVARAEQEHRQLQSNVQQKKEWEAARERREVDDVTRLVHDETRVRRNVDNQEAVGYITIMTGLIEGVERAKQQWTQRRAREEKEKEHRLESLLREERAKEERCASEMLSQRMLAQV